MGEDAGISGGIRARAAPDGRLIDADDFVNILAAADGFVRARLLARAIKFLRQRAIKNVVHQSGFAGAGNAGDHGHHAQGKGDVEIAQIILPRAQHADGVSVGLAALFPVLDAHLAGHVLAGERIGGAHDVFGGAGGHQRAAVASRARAEINDVIGAANGFFIVLDYQNRVA